ncbi:MAG: YraN family protein, partial [Oscillospiraceae bacterium]
MNQNGVRGEQFAACMLLGDGYEILARNYRTRRGELDLVAKKGDTLAFIEVKTRSARSLGSPASAVTPAKQRCLIRAALDYLANNPNEL